MITLEIKKREKSNKDLREEGMMPAVFYGKKEDSTSISVKLTDFLKVWKEAGESSVVSLKDESGDKEALVRDVQWDPITGLPRHVDFYVFEKGHKLEVPVSIEFVGVAPAVKELGGTLVKVLHEINIKALPKDLPHNINVDISSLVDFDSQILAKDVKLPEGVELIEKPEEVVALAEEIKEEVVEEAPSPDLSEIEIEKKGKKEEAAGDTSESSQEGQKSSAEGEKSN
jgi:large subunit ribosomal protein L25